MPTIVILVAAAAAIGVGLVVYGIVGPGRAAVGAGPSARVTYRSLADVREQLRRRFEPTGAPVWIAANQTTNQLAADLASADLQLRPYEFRLVQAASALVFALVALLRFGFAIPVLAFAVIGFAVPALYLRNRRGHRLGEFEVGLPRAMELMANSMKAGQSISQSFRSVVENAGAEVRAEVLASTAQSRASSLIITLLPIAAALLLYFLVPEYFRPMFTNPLGWFMLAVAAVMLAIGNFIIRRLTAIT